ncbi:MAG TPA: hypothetical protein VEP89_18305, partial [Draconibacterium sp.]|nr:hypothetical protein [Draconibacterium sp.]
KGGVYENNLKRLAYCYKTPRKEMLWRILKTVEKYNIFLLTKKQVGIIRSKAFFSSVLKYGAVIKNHFSSIFSFHVRKAHKTLLFIDFQAHLTHKRK